MSQTSPRHIKNGTKVTISSNDPVSIKRKGFGTVIEQRGFKESRMGNTARVMVLWHDDGRIKEQSCCRLQTYEDFISHWSKQRELASEMMELVQEG